MVYDYVSKIGNIGKTKGVILTDMYNQE